MKIISSLLLVNLVLACPDFQPGNPSTRADSSFRLPKNIKPINYELTLRPDLSPDLDPVPFYGSMVLTLTPTENTRNITLKIRQLSINDSSVSLVDSNGSEIGIELTYIDSDNEFYIISLREEIAVDEVYRLGIGSYEGTLQLDNAGFYLALYEEDGVQKRMATTQFQSHGARKTFPSLDEPEFKATFTVNLIRPANFSSISNEILLESNDIGNGLVQDKYKESVVMSTYLLALVVSEYEYVQSENQRVFARPQAIRDGWAEYALTTGLETMEALQNYLGIPYSLEKMDQIAIPDIYFAPGAMENWGLVIYKESYLLYAEEYSTTTQLQKITTVIAHEFGHQWFGNLVTLSWWEYTWLNEGFATYYEYFGASLLKPDWRLMDQFVFVVQAALEYDSTNSTEAMSYETESGDGPPTLISYQKAGSVLRMIQHFLTSDVFKDGQIIYLQNRQFDVATPEDLYEALQTALDAHSLNALLNGNSVASVLAPWTDQAGYPLLTVTRNYGLGTITLRQERFLQRNYSNVNANSLWPIPINFMFSAIDNYDFDNTTTRHWLTEAEQTLDESFTDDGLLIVNKQQTGYYRVNYDTENWYKIIQHLRDENIEDIHVLNRAKVLDDAFSLAFAGRLNYEVAFDLSKYVSRERDYIPLKIVVDKLDVLNKMLAASEEYQLFKEYVSSLLKPTADSLGFYDSITDSHVDKLNRVNLLSKLCDLGDEDCRSSALSLLRQWASGEMSAISPDMQLYTFCGALRIGNADDWNFVFDRYVLERQEFMRSRLLSALGCSENEDILKGYLDQIISSESVIPQSEKQTAFTSVYNSGNTGLNAAFDYLKNNFEAVSNSSLDLNTIISGIGSRLTSSEQMNQLEELAESTGSSAFSSTLRTVQDNIEWCEQYVPVIVNWLHSL